MRSRILELLREAGSEFLSGEDLAERLKVSRNAIWKHIQDLREAGYDIVSHSRRGYLLQGVPDLLLPAEIKFYSSAKLLGQEIFYHDSLPSTNDEAKRLASAGAPDGTLVVAEAQGAGRGRLSRGWFSPHAKGLWFSVILRPPLPPQAAPKFTLMAAVAILRAMRKAGFTVGIKWPNDILYQGKKLVGILTEMSAEIDRINYIVIGMGVNVNVAASDFPPELRDIATSLAIMKGEPLSRAALLADVLGELEELYFIVLEDGFAPVLDEWRAHSLTLGQTVNVIGVDETFAGEAVDIDDEGALIVATESGRRRVLAGDVSIRPRA